MKNFLIQFQFSGSRCNVGIRPRRQIFIRIVLWFYALNFTSVHGQSDQRLPMMAKHGLRTLNEAFFQRNPKFFGLFGQFGQINFGVFSADLLAPILVQWVPCPCFPLIKHYFYKKLGLYIQIPNIYLGLGFEFEFGPPRIRDLAIVCP